MPKQFASQEPLNPSTRQKITLTTASGEITLRTTDNSYQDHVEEFARALANCDPRDLLAKLKAL